MYVACCLVLTGSQFSSIPPLFVLLLVVVNMHHRERKMRWSEGWVSGGVLPGESWGSQSFVFPPKRYKYSTNQKWQRLCASDWRKTMPWCIAHKIQRPTMRSRCASCNMGTWVLWSCFKFKSNSRQSYLLSEGCLDLYKEQVIIYKWTPLKCIAILLAS